MLEPILEHFTPLARLTVFTPLGIRFWDAALDQPVRDGLHVTAWPPDQPQAAVRAVRTMSGVYAFHGLPGLHDSEYPSVGNPLQQSPLPVTRLVVEVYDTQRRFLPMVFAVNAPYPGIFPTTANSHVAERRLPGFFLFSAPTRPVLPTQAVIRAQVVDRADRHPIAYALLEIQLSGQPTVYGIADENGKVATVFPYPTFTLPPRLQSPPLPASANGAQRWPIIVRVRSSPANLTVPVGSRLPDLRSIVNQAPAAIWSTLALGPGPPVDQLSAELVFGQELVLSTEDESTLLISPTASPL